MKVGVTAKDTLQADTRPFPCYNHKKPGLSEMSHVAVLIRTNNFNKLRTELPSQILLGPQITDNSDCLKKGAISTESRDSKPPTPLVQVNVCCPSSLILSSRRRVGEGYSSLSAYLAYLSLCVCSYSFALGDSPQNTTNRVIIIIIFFKGTQERTL